MTSRVRVTLQMETRPLAADVALLAPQYPTVLFFPRDGFVADDFGLNNDAAMNPLASEVRAALARAGYPTATGLPYNPRVQLFKSDSTVSPVDLGTAFELHVGAVVESASALNATDSGAIAEALAPVIRAKMAVPSVTVEAVRSRLSVETETPPTATETTWPAPAQFVPWRSSDINPSAVPYDPSQGGGGGGGGNGNPPTPPPAAAPSMLGFWLLAGAGVAGLAILATQAPKRRR